ncbi:hypothetical protein [Rhodococcoides fascians]|uniref:hypothetical protein n=1 Tax=Rhodococcoides fascians TaxID=1828 RepID=UPI001114AD16|nr:hypothetical protein [Rhodococcus fascians]
MSEDESVSSGDEAVEDEAVKKEPYPLAEFNDSRLAIYMNEIARHAQVAQTSIDSLDETLQSMPVDQNKLFMGVQSLLASSAMISKLVWPDTKNAEARAEDPVAQWTKDRGTKLRAALKLDKTSVLYSRKLRNTLEHYDERLDRFVSKSYNTFMLEWTVTASSHVAEVMGEEDHEDMPMVTWIDPDTLVVRIMTVRNSLRDINVEVQRVGAIAAEWPGF